MHDRATKRSYVPNSSDVCGVSLVAECVNHTPCACVAVKVRREVHTVEAVGANENVD